MNKKIEFTSQEKSKPIKNFSIVKNNILQRNTEGFTRKISINYHETSEVLNQIEAIYYFLNNENVGEIRVYGDFMFRPQNLEPDVSKISLTLTNIFLKKKIELGRIKLNFKFLVNEINESSNSKVPFTAVFLDDFIHNSFEDLRDAEFKIIVG